MTRTRLAGFDPSTEELGPEDLGDEALAAGFAGDEGAEALSGAQQDRPPSTDEWKSGTLNLRDDGWGSTSTMTKDGRDWIVRSTGGGVNEFGCADCW